MSILTRIDVSNVRNLTQVSIHPSSHTNLVVGSNGSGKTSLLEAIHLAAVGRSFRTHNINKVVSKGAEALVVFAEYLLTDSVISTVGVERGRGIARFRVNGSDSASIAELARLAPLQVITPDSHQLIELGPRYRRRFVDWGMFHVEQEFFPVWRRFGQAIKQRNAALRQSSASRSEIGVWNQELSACEHRITRLRQSYIAELVPYARKAAESLLGVASLEIKLLPGWAGEQSYERYLERAFSQDRSAGYTRHGPHRADLAISIDGVPTREILSRGEQKLIASALRLSQVKLLQDRLTRNCILLIDDLPSELDIGHRLKFIDYLNQLKCQIFISTTEPQLIGDRLSTVDKLFHVERGRIKEML